MFTRNLSLSTKIVPILVNQAIAQSTPLALTDGMGVDMAGYQSVTFVCVQSAVAAANTAILSAAYGATSAASASAAVTGSPVTVAINNTCQTLELARPSKRYVWPVVTGGSGNGATVTVIAILTGREPQELGAGNPCDNMVPVAGTFNTTTGVFDGNAIVASAAHTPTSKLLIANP